MKNLASILVLSLLGLAPLGHNAAFAADGGQPNPASPEAASNIRGGMVVSPLWTFPQPTGNASMFELHELLRSVAKADQNPNPTPKGTPISIYGGVTYLMPLEEAKRVLGLPQVYSPKTPLGAPGFPHRSLFINTFSSKLEPNFDKLYLVTDSKDQVVAVEFATEISSKVKGYDMTSKKEWITWDFVNFRLKAVSTVSIHHRIHVSDGRSNDSSRYRSSRSGNELVEIESLFIDSKTETKKASRLLMPMPLAELCCFYIENVSASRNAFPKKPQ